MNETVKIHRSPQLGGLESSCVYRTLYLAYRILYIVDCIYGMMWLATASSMTAAGLLYKDHLRR